MEGQSPEQKWTKASRNQQALETDTPSLSQGTLALKPAAKMMP